MECESNRKFGIQKKFLSGMEGVMHKDKSGNSNCDERVEIVWGCGENGR